MQNFHELLISAYLEKLRSHWLLKLFNLLVGEDPCTSYLNSSNVHGNYTHVLHGLLCKQILDNSCRSGQPGLMHSLDKHLSQSRKQIQVEKLSIQRNNWVNLLSFSIFDLSRNLIWELIIGTPCVLLAAKISIKCISLKK